MVPTSMHCYFIFAGDGELPILYHVERVVDRFESAVRAVRAKQGGQLICTATVKFCSSADDIADELSMPVPVVDPPPLDEGSGDDRAWDSVLPYQSSNAEFVRMSTT